MNLVIKTILLMIGTLLILDVGILSLVSNFNFGIIITFVVAVLCVVYGLFFEKINLVTQKGLFKWVKYIVFLCTAFMLCIVAFLGGYGQIDTVNYKEDALIILGAGIRGETVTLPLKYRLDTGISYLSKNPNAVIVVSGGQGNEETTTEALAMEKYLIKNGVPKEKILKEEKATSTYENFLFSKKILDNYFNVPYQMAFITNDFHIYRASEISKIVGLNSTYCHTKLQWYLTPITYTREVLAVIKLWVLKQ